MNKPTEKFPVGKILISWKITPEEIYKRTRAIARIVLSAEASAVFYFCWRMYFEEDGSALVTASVGLLIIIASAAFLYLYKPKSTQKYIIGENGILVKNKGFIKLSAWKFHPWKKLSSYYLTRETSGRFFSPSQIDKIQETTGKIFSIRHKGPFLKNLIALQIQAEPDNSDKVEDIIKEHLPYKEYNVKNETWKSFILIGLGLVIAVIVIVMILI